MLTEALRYPLAGRAGRDALAVCTGLVLVALLLVRLSLALWPSWLALLPAALIVAPVLLFAGYLGTVLRDGATDDAPPQFRWSRETLRTGARFLTVGAVYLLPPVVALLGTVFVLLEVGATPSDSPLVAIAPTVALVVLLTFAYVLPAAVASGLHGGVRAGLSRSALGGLASGGYFFVWTVALSLSVVSWSVLGATGTTSAVAVIGAVAVAYGHIVTVRLLGQGLARSRWEPPA